MVVASPAQAVPAPGPNESIVFDYFSNATKTVQVGGWVYGSCLEDFQWGIRTGYYNWHRVTCNPQDRLLIGPSSRYHRVPLDRVSRGTLRD